MNRPENNKTDTGATDERSEFRFKDPVRQRAAERVLAFRAELLKNRTNEKPSWTPMRAIGLRIGG